jgi:hypothetical protein
MGVENALPGGRSCPSRAPAPWKTLQEIRDELDQLASSRVARGRRRAMRVMPVISCPEGAILPGTREAVAGLLRRPDSSIRRRNQRHRPTPRSQAGVSSCARARSTRLYHSPRSGVGRCPTQGGTARRRTSKGLDQRCMRDQRHRARSQGRSQRHMEAPHYRCGALPVVTVPSPPCSR